MNLPRYIITLIDAKKHQKKISDNFPSKSNKSKLNLLTDTIKNEIEAFKKTKLENLCEQLADIDVAA